MGRLSKFIEFLISNSYQLIEDNEQFRFIIYEHEHLFIKIEQDRNKERFISLSRTNNRGYEGWYDMEIIYHFILKIHYKKRSPYKFKHLNQFFIDHYEEIMDTFSLVNLHNTEVALSALKDERAKVLFGY